MQYSKPPFGPSSSSSMTSWPVSRQGWLGDVSSQPHLQSNKVAHVCGERTLEVLGGWVEVDNVDSSAHASAVRVQLLTVGGLPGAVSDDGGNRSLAHAPCRCRPGRPRAARSGPCARLRLTPCKATATNCRAALKPDLRACVYRPTTCASGTAADASCRRRHGDTPTAVVRREGSTTSAGRCCRRVCAGKRMRLARQPAADASVYCS